MPITMTSSWPSCNVFTDAEKNGYCKMGCPWTSFSTQPLCWWIVGSKLPSVCGICCVQYSYCVLYHLPSIGIGQLLPAKYPFCRHIVIKFFEIWHHLGMVPLWGSYCWILASLQRSLHNPLRSESLCIMWFQCQCWVQDVINDLTSTYGSSLKSPATWSTTICPSLRTLCRLPP